MKARFLAAAAAIAIVASGAVAKAQDNQNHEQRPAAERSQPGGAEGAHMAPKAAQMERRDEPKGAEAAQPNHAPKVNQAEQQGGAQDKERREPPKAAQNERENTPARADERRRAAESDEKTAPGRQPAEQGRTQPTRERVAEPNGQRERDPAARTGANENTRERAPAARTGENENRNDKRTAQHQEGRPRVIGNVRSSEEHATRVGETLHRMGRREHVDFAINVGARVPERVEIVPVPEDIISFAPEYRGYDYFVDDNDEVVFVSPETHEVVGAIDYEGRAAADEPSVNVAGARPCPVEQ